MPNPDVAVGALDRSALAISAVTGRGLEALEPAIVGLVERGKASQPHREAVAESERGALAQLPFDLAIERAVDLVGCEQHHDIGRANGILDQGSFEPCRLAFGSFEQSQTTLLFRCELRLRRFALWVSS